MAIRYRIQEKSNPADALAPKKFYLVQKSLGFIGRKELIADVVNRTSLTKQEATTGIDYLFEVVPNYLRLGFTVQLGELGYFRTTLKSAGSNTKEEATVDKVEKIRIRFTFGKAIREMMNNTALEKFPE